MYSYKNILFLLLVFFFGVTSTLSMTALVVRKTAKEIIVGADTLETNTTRGQTHACKIFVFDRVVVAFADAVYSNSGYDARKIAKSVCGSAKSVDDCTAAFELAIMGPFERDLESFRQNKPELFVKGNWLLRSIFMGVQGKSGVLIEKIFMQESNKIGIPSNVKIQTDSSYTFDEKFYVNRPEGEIVKYYNNPAFWRKHGNIGGVRRLIEMMKEDFPNDIGGTPAIVVVNVRTGKINWIDPPAVCKLNSFTKTGDTKSRNATLKKNRILSKPTKSRKTTQKKASKGM